MGLSDFFSDIYAALSVTEAHAEAPSEGDAGVSGGASTKSPASGTDEEGGEEAEANKADADKKSSGGDDEDGGDEGGEEEEEEEEEEEPEDVKPKLEEGELS